MQIIILRKNKTHTVKIQNWMYMGLFASICVAMSAPLMTYISFSESSQGLSVNHINTGQKNNLSDQGNSLISPILTEKMGQIQAQVLYLDQLLLTVKDKLNITEIHSPNDIDQHHDKKNIKYKNAELFQGKGGAILLSELEHPLIDQPKSDPAFAILDGMSENDIRKLAKNHQKKEFKGSTFDDLNRLVTQLGDKIQNRVQEVSSIDALLEFRNTKNIKFDIMPVQSSRLTSGFGWRQDPFHGTRTMHAGQDFAGVVGTPIQAVRAGVVVASEYHPQYGNMIDIDHGDGLKTRYAHNSELLFKVGSTIKKGSVIAKMGSTGRSTGSHLHFEVRLNNVPYNPVLFMSGSALAQR